jgi:hypothetical protein
MSFEDQRVSLAPATTRRRLLKTGAKFAYAAPPVAATFQLTGHGALAHSCKCPGYTARVRYFEILRGAKAGMCAACRPTANSYNQVQQNCFGTALRRTR